MKKFILSLGLIAMAFNLTNCAQYEEATPSVETKGDFALYASVSRTANDGLNTVWSTGDDLGVFHAVTDGTTYTKDGQFKLEDATTGCFLGNVNGTLDSQEEYDWYAMYPYSSYVPGPKNTGSGYMTIGCAASATQTQTGNNSLAHVAGKNFPLVGKAYAVPAGSAPALAMTHVATLLEFEVTNSLDEAITVSNIKFTAPAALVGTFYIDFTDIANITATSSGSSYTSKSATLIVKNGEAIAAGASAKFYLPVAPFTAAANAKLALEVNVTAGEKVGLLSKEITLATETSFKAGKIKPIKVNYNVEFVDEGLALPFSDDFTWVKSGQNEGTDISSSLKKENYSTGTKIYPVAAGGEIKFGTSSILGSLTTVPLNLSQPFTVVVEAKAWSGDSSQLAVVVNGVTQKTGNLGNAYSSYKFEFDAATAASPVTFNITGKRGFISDIKIVAGHNYVLPPELTVSAPAEVAAAGGTVSVDYSVKNPVDGETVVATTTATWIEDFDYSTAGKISFTVVENTSDESREANITVAYAGAESVVIAVKQAAKPAEGGVVSWKKESWSKFTTTSTSYAAHTIVGDLGTWSCTGCSAYENTSTAVVKNTGFKYVTMGKTGDNAKITSPSFANGVQGLKFKYYVNNTARKFKVIIYENGAAVKTVTVTPTAKTTLLSYEIDVETTGSTYFTFEPTSSDRRVSIGEIEVLY